MRAIDLKERVDAVCKINPNLNIFIKIEYLDGSYNVYDSEAMVPANFNGLFLIQPEVHEQENCAVITGSEVPLEDGLDAEEFVMDKAAAEQAYLDGAMDAEQFIQVLISNGYLNLP